MLNDKYRVSLEGSGVKWDFKTKMRRGLWKIATLFFRMSPKKSGNRFRLFLINCFGGDVHPRCWIFPSVKITDPKFIKVGAWSVIGPNVQIYNYALVSIGSQTVVSQNTYLCTASHDYTDPKFKMIWSFIDIESEAWVAEGVMILPGVTIGEGAVVGARSVVTKDMPAWMVCAGHPCKPIKPRVINK